MISVVSAAAIILQIFCLKISPSYETCVTVNQTPCYNDPEPLGCFPINSDGPFCHQLVPPQNPISIAAKFYFYTPEYGSEGVQLIEFYDHFLTPTVTTLHMDMTKPLWILVHGFQSDWPKDWMFPMKDALIQKGMNVLLVRWTGGSGGIGLNYLQAVANTRVVGAMIARILTVMQDVKQLDLNDVTLVGFSLGAHVVGFAGAALDGRVRRIIGMDPAGPLFEGYDPVTRLDPTDAQFVQAIHCNGEQLTNGGFGTLQQMAHIDFYANGGKFQPGCPPGLRSTWTVTAVLELACSHTRCPFLLTTSILDEYHDSPCRFTAFACDSTEHWLAGNCFRCNLFGNCPNPGYAVDLGSPYNGRYYFDTEANNQTLAFFCGQQYRFSVLPFTALPKGHGGNITIQFYYPNSKPVLSQVLTLLGPDDTLGILTKYSRILVAPPNFQSIAALTLRYNPGPKTKVTSLDFVMASMTNVRGGIYAIPSFYLEGNVPKPINFNW